MGISEKLEAFCDIVGKIPNNNMEWVYIKVNYKRYFCIQNQEKIKIWKTYGHGKV